MSEWGNPNGPDDQARQHDSGAPQYGGPPPTQPPGHGQAPPPQYGQYAPPQHEQASHQYGMPPAPPMGNPMGFGAPRPGVIPLRPLTLGDIFEGAFKTLRGNPMATFGLAFVVSVVVAIPTVLTTLALQNVRIGEAAIGEISVAVINNVDQIFASVASVLLAGMLTVVVADAVLGRRMTIGEAWTKIKSRLLPLIGAGMLIFLAVVLTVVALVALGFGVYALAGTAATVVYAVVAFIGFVVAAMWFWVSTSLATPAIALEGMGPVEGLKRSFSLVRGDFWRILGISLLASLLVGVIASMLVIPFAIVAALAGGVASGAEPQGPAYVLILQVGTILVTTLTVPFTSAVTALLYIDRRIRQEGLDRQLIDASTQS